MNVLRNIWADTRRSLRYRRVLAAPAWAIVLRYHSVGPPDLVSRYVDRGLSVSQRDFHAQVAWLKQHFRIDTLAATLARLQEPKPDKPSIVLSFDDGYRDNYTHALPVLLEHDTSAIFYITTDPIECGRGLWTSELLHLVPQLPDGTHPLPDMEKPVVVDANRSRLRRRLTRSLAAMPRQRREACLDRLCELAGRERGQGLSDSFVTPQQLREMSDQGMEIGAHTRSHPHLDLVDTSEHRDEIDGSRARIEEIIDRPVVDLAFPNPGGRGTGGPKSRESAHQLSLRSAATSTAGTLARETDVLRLPRIGVYSGRQQVTMFRALARLVGAPPPLLGVH